MSPQKQTALNKTVNGSLDLRQLLKNTYPWALALHEIATASVKARGHYPVSQSARTPDDDIDVDDDIVHLRSPTEDDFTMPALEPPPKEKKKKKAKGDKLYVKAPKELYKPLKGPRATLKGPIKTRSSPERTSPRRQAAHAAINANTATQNPEFAEFSDKFVSGQCGFEPKNLKEAKAHATWPLWKAAMEKEVTRLLD
jgi:hypothetical protein